MDRARAMELYLRAAEAGDSMGMNNYAACLHDSARNEQDVAEATRWYERAVAAGNPVAMFNLGRNKYEGGDGALYAQDGLVLIQRSARLGCQAAIDYLALRGLKAE